MPGIVDYFMEHWYLLRSRTERKNLGKLDIDIPNFNIEPDPTNVVLLVFEKKLKIYPI